MKNSYAILQGDQIVATSGRLAVARKHRRGVAGRRIIRIDAQGEMIALRTYGGGTFRIRGVEVT